MTSRDVALQIASDHLRQQRRHARIHAVLGWDEITWRKPVPYTVRPVCLAECWVCYQTRSFDESVQGFTQPAALDEKYFDGPRSPQRDVWRASEQHQRYKF